MISSELQKQFSLLEMAAFPVWKSATEKERERITKELARVEARMIINEAKKESEKICSKNT